MFKHSRKFGVVILFIILKLAAARIISSSDLNAIDNSDENSIINDAEEYYYNSEEQEYYYNSEEEEEDNSNKPECELSELPPKPDSKCCGIDVLTNDRIVGGTPTLIKQYPWLALIEYTIVGTNETRLKCGGSLISGLYVLTAGHCVTGSILERSPPVNVILGDYDKYHSGPDCVMDAKGMLTCTEGEVRIGIANITPHEFYDPYTLENDIALIKLAKVAPYTDFIRPICLPTSDLTMSFHKNLWLSAAGWGVMKQVNTSGGYYGETSNLKLDVQLPYVPPRKCKKSWPVTKNHICAGGVKGQDACMGDSGGPLMFNNDGQFQLAGAVSYGAGSPCGVEKLPGVYTNVYRYRNWIMSTILGS